MTKKVLSIFALIVLISGVIGSLLLTRGQSWLDDFAGYLLQAKSILNGSMGAFILQNTFTVGQSTYPPGPVAYPWGFPLLLVPVYALFGLNTLALELVNVAFYMLFLIVFFGLARTRLNDVAALLLTAVLAFNPVLLQAQSQIISDLPFLFFSTLGIFLIDRSARQKYSLRGGLVLGVVLFMAAFIRTNGVLLLVPLGLLEWMDLRHERPGRARFLAGLPARLSPYVTFAALFVLQALIFPNGQGSYLDHFAMFSLPGLWNNLLYYLWLPSATFTGLPGAGLLYPLLLVFVLIAVFRSSRPDWLIHSYTLATLTLFIFWPERQGLRFIYPVLPFLFIFAFAGMNTAIAWLRTTWQRSAGWIVAGLWVVLAVLSLVVSLSLAQMNLADDRSITGPFDPVSAQLFQFLREKTPQTSVVIFFKPRSMALLTGRASFTSDRCADLPKADYLAISRKVELNGLIPLQELTVCTASPPLQKVFENRRFIVYRIGG